MASGGTILREGPLFQPLASAPFSERPRARLLARSLSLSFSLYLVRRSTSFVY